MDPDQQSLGLEAELEALRERVRQRQQELVEACKVWDQTNIEARQLQPLDRARFLLRIAENELRRIEARLATVVKAARKVVSPPDLQVLVLQYGTYDKITLEAWAKFGANMAEWKAKIRAGEHGDERVPLPKSEVNNRRTYPR